MSLRECMDAEDSIDVYDEVRIPDIFSPVEAKWPEYDEDGSYLPPVWFCSDFAEHEHRWRLSAWLCGRVQYVRYLLKGVK